MIEHYLFESDDPKILFNAAGGYYRLTQSPTKYQYTLSEKVVKKYIELLDHEDIPDTEYNLKYAVLNVIEAVIDSEKRSDQSQMFLNNGILTKMPSLLSLEVELALEKSLLVLAKLIQKHPSIIDTVLDEQIISKVIKSMYRKDIQTKNTATLVITFLALDASESQILSLINAKALHGFCYSVKWFEKEEPTLQGILSTYAMILKKAESHQKLIFDILDECDGIKILYRLRKHRNRAISGFAVDIVNMFESIESKQYLKNVEL